MLNTYLPLTVIVFVINVKWFTVLTEAEAPLLADRPGAASAAAVALLRPTVDQRPATT